MSRLIKLTLFFLWLPWNLWANSNPPCSQWPSFFRPACLRVHQIWQEGDPELYISGYAWHNRYTYTRERLNQYNEAAWGGGLGKGLYDEKGNWHGLFAFAFLDSHKNIEPIAGYAYLKMAHFTSDIGAGIGISAFVTQRRDIFNGIPFPGVLPWMSINIKRFSLSGTYIPGAVGAGNVLYIVGKWRF